MNETEGGRNFIYMHAITIIFLSEQPHSPSIKKENYIRETTGGILLGNGGS
jgi:hypothetical protein